MDRDPGYAWLTWRLTQSSFGSVAILIFFVPFSCKREELFLSLIYGYKELVHGHNTSSGKTAQGA